MKEEHIFTTRRHRQWCGDGQREEGRGWVEVGKGRDRGWGWGEAGDICDGATIKIK